MPRERRRRLSRSRRTARRSFRSADWRARLGVGALAIVLLIAVPATRRAASTLWWRLERAMAAARAAEAHERETRRFAHRYGISREMAAAVERAAVAEGVEPELAFRLVRVESAFVEHAVSPVGALGLTQLMPATAEELEPGISRQALLERDTNLRLGLRYFRRLLSYYRGDTRAALHAYNRGIGTVDRIRAAGGDPANGYAAQVLGPAGASPAGPVGAEAPGLPDSVLLHEMAPAQLPQGQ